MATPKKPKKPVGFSRVETPEQAQLRARRAAAFEERHLLYDTLLEDPTMAGILTDQRRVYLQGMTWSLSQIARTQLLLPTFQRKPVWSTERQLSFLNYVLRGGIITPIYLLERGLQDYLVIDGQQRLRALTVGIHDLQGRTFPPHTIRFSLEQRRFVDMGPDTHEASLSDHIAGGASDLIGKLQDDWASGKLSDREFAHASVSHQIQYALGFVIQIPVITAGWSSEMTRSHEFQVDFFRALNRQGVPLSEEEIEDLIAASTDMRKTDGT